MPAFFRFDAAQAFDRRCLFWRMEARTVSIWTVSGWPKNLDFGHTWSTSAGVSWWIAMVVIRNDLACGHRASLALHHQAGFRTVGVRERIARLHGRWRDTVLLERRGGAGSDTDTPCTDDADCSTV